MNPTAVWLTILGIGAGTFALRLSFIHLWGRLHVPPVLMRALNYVPSAVLAALVVPALARHGGHLDLSPDNLRLMAGMIAATAAWFTRSVLVTLCVGMGALWILQALI